MPSLPPAPHGAPSAGPPPSLVIVAHIALAFLGVWLIFRVARREYARAKEGWRRFTEEPASDNPEDFKPAWGDGDKKALDLGAQVLHPKHGRGVVTSFTSFRREGGGVTVLYEAAGETHTHVGEDREVLLQEGHRVAHPQRGSGVVRGFDEMGRVHIEFDSGEYHRYKSADWQRKIHHSSRRARQPQTSGRQFLQDYALYRVDYVLSTFAFAKPLLLLAMTYLLIVVGALFYSHSANVSYLESLWVAWTFVADPGAHSDQRGTVLRTIAFFLTVGGMLVFALMIGIIADGVSSVLDGLKQGKSVVIENGHTLILGWSDKTLPLIREIALANESERGGVIVVLADRPKAEMELELSKDLAEEEARGTFVVVRQGSPTSQMDLRKVSAGGARSIVVLADSSLDPDESDAHALRVIMSLTGIRKPSTGHVVVELCDVDNRDLILLVDPHNVEVIVAHDLIGRAMIQCARQPGLAQILDEILGFEGDEFYVKVFPELAGLTFGEVLFRFPDAIPLGVKPRDRSDAHRQILGSQWRLESLRRRGFNGEIVTVDEGSFSLQGGSSMAPVVDHFADKIEEEASPPVSREVVLNPPNDYVIRPGDGILVLAEDDDTFAPVVWGAEEVGVGVAGADGEERKQDPARVALQEMEPAHRPVVMNQPEKFLFCGWRRDMVGGGGGRPLAHAPPACGRQDDMILELDELVGAGSELTIMCTVPVHERARRMEEGGLNVAKLRNIALNHVVGNPILRRDLDKLRLQAFSSVLILADEALESNMSSADSRSLASLFLIRDLIAKKNKAMQVSVPVHACSRSPRTLARTARNWARSAARATSRSGPAGGTSPVPRCQGRPGSPRR
jgi:hypothetical protein